MAKQKIYHVTPHDEGWAIEAEGAKQPSAVESRKTDAVKRAREIAENQQPSQVIVYKQDGTYQKDYTYGDGQADPQAAARRGEAKGLAANAGYALAGLADDALKLASEAIRLARALPAKAQDRAQELRDLKARRDELDARVREFRETAEERFDEKATKGRTVAEDLLGDERVKRVIEQAKTAQTQVKAAFTSIRKTTEETLRGATTAGKQQADTARSQVKGAATSVQKTAETAVEAGKDATGNR